MVKTEHLDPSYSFYPINSFTINISLPNEKFFAAGDKFEREFYREWISLDFEFLKFFAFSLLLFVCFVKDCQSEIILEV